jgi:hypothetical protein
MFVYAQVASTAKLFATPLQGSPNVSVDTPTLQLLDPMQAFFTIDSDLLLLQRPW